MNDGNMDSDWDAPAAAPSPLVVNGLVKVFGPTFAVNGMTFAVPRGSCTGLVGPNGSGKSTTLRAVVGLVVPNQGSITVCGHDITHPNPTIRENELLEARKRTGVVTDPLAMFERLSAREYLRTIAELRSVDRATADERGNAMFEVLQLGADADRPISGYSHGMRKKTALAVALIHRPELLLLDEPFEGVDPVSARTIRAMLDRYRQGGGTVVLSSHVMEIVERLCDYVVVVAYGRAVVQGGTEAVRAGRRLEDVFVEAVGAVDVDVSSLDWLS